MRKVIVWSALCALLFAGCQSPRAKYEARKAEVSHAQDSLMSATQLELVATDSLLVLAQQDFDRLDSTVSRQADREAALQQLTRLRLRRDSLKIRWETLGAQIRYLKKKQNESKK